MKKVLVLIPIIAIGIFAFIIIKDNKEKTIKNEKIDKIKQEWHVEITNEYINVRENSTRSSKAISKVKKGEFYKVIGFKEDDKTYFWYKIEMDDEVIGWIANPKSGDKYLIDNKNPNDIASPILKYKEDEYRVNSIDDINYDQLILWDDKLDECVVTHTVYHETASDKDQYWILYTITDKKDRSDSKLQKIIFTEKPDEDKVINFEEYKKRN